MKAVIYNDVNEYKTMKNIIEPNINEIFNVKVKVSYCGICGSDIHKLLSERPNKDYVKTRILGHEISGTVVEVMPNVKNINVGDTVVVEPLLYCGKCEMCKKGYIQFCEKLKSLGKDFSGGFAEYVVANEKQIYKIENKTDIIKATLSDPYSVAMHVKNLTKAQKRKIGIIGDGIMGIACSELLSLENEVTVFGKHNNRKNILKAIEVKYQDIKDINNYLNYFDIVIETVGGKQNNTLYNSINICDRKGKIIVVGVYDNNFTFNISLRKAFYKEISIVGCNSFETIENVSEFKLALDYLINESKIATELISKIYHIDEFQEAIEYIRNRNKNNCVKVMIKI